MKEKLLVFWSLSVEIALKEPSVTGLVHGRWAPSPDVQVPGTVVNGAASEGVDSGVQLRV